MQIIRPKKLRMTKMTKSLVTGRKSGPKSNFLKPPKLSTPGQIAWASAGTTHFHFIENQSLPNEENFVTQRKINDPKIIWCLNIVDFKRIPSGGGFAKNLNQSEKKKWSLTPSTRGGLLASG